mgnify:CR=1 FL=1
MKGEENKIEGKDYVRERDARMPRVEKARYERARMRITIRNRGQQKDSRTREQNV